MPDVLTLVQTLSFRSLKSLNKKIKKTKNKKSEEFENKFTWLDDQVSSLHSIRRAGITSAT